MTGKEEGNERKKRGGGKRKREEQIEKIGREGREEKRRKRRKKVQKPKRSTCKWENTENGKEREKIQIQNLRAMKNDYF